MPEPVLISRWNTLVEDFQIAPSTFYTYVDVALTQRAVPNLRTSRVKHSEGGFLSASREYLRAERDGYTFDICCAPFGTGCFVSWWLFNEEGNGCLGAIPILGPILVWLAFFANPLTYYRLDSALMFQQAVHQAVLQVLDGVTKEKGIRQLSQDDRKPIMRDFFSR